MALTSVIGALRVVLGVDTAAFDNGMKKAQSNVSSFGKDITKIAAGIGLERVLESAVSGLVGGLKHAFVAIDELGKTSQKIGVPIEELSKMQHAADLSGVSLEGLSKGMGKLSQTMFESTRSGTTPAAQAFQRLGISAVDSAGNLKLPSDVMIELAGKFSTMENGAVKTALAMQLFGRAGKDMIPLLNSGKQGLQEMADEAQAFGLVVSQRTFLAVELFNDNLTRLGKIGKGVANTVTAELAPALAFITTRMVESARASDFVSISAKKIVDAFLGVTEFVLKVMIHLERMNEEIKITAGFFVALSLDIRDILGPAITWLIDKITVFYDKLQNLPGTKVLQQIADIHRAITLLGFELFRTAPAADAVSEAEKGLGANADKVTGAFSRTTSAVMQYSVAAAAARGATSNLSTMMQDMSEQARMVADHLANNAKGFKATGGGAVAAANAIDQFLKSQAKSIAGQQAEALAVGLATGAKERLKLVMEAEAIAAENGIKMTQAQIVKLTELANAAQLAALQLKGANLIQDSLPAWQKYQMEVDNAKLALESIGATAPQIEMVLRNMAEKAGATWEQALGGIAGGFSSLFKEMAKSGGKWGTFAKALAIFEATINTYTAFTKALAAPPGPPLSYAIAAGVLAAGMAKVMAIKSQKEPKMATGGMMRMSNFASGPDSQLLTARVRPDEQIDIWRPGEGPDMRRGGEGGVREIVIRVDEISRATVEKLIPALNSALGDGHRLRMGTV